MVRLTVSATYPRMVFTVFQLQSPFRSFFKEMSSLLNNESLALKGRNMWLMVCRSVCRTLQRFGSCVKEMKWSMNMPTYCKGSPVVDRDGSNTSGGSTKAQGIFSWMDASVVGNGTAVAMLSR